MNRSTTEYCTTFDRPLNVKILLHIFLFKHGRMGENEKERSRSLY